MTALPDLMGHSGIGGDHPATIRAEIENFRNGPLLASERAAIRNAYDRHNRLPPVEQITVDLARARESLADDRAHLRRAVRYRWITEQAMRVDTSVRAKERYREAYSMALRAAGFVKTWRKLVAWNEERLAAAVATAPLANAAE